MLSGPDREGLNKAYVAFVTQAVEIEQRNSKRRQLLQIQGRLLEVVAFDPATARVYKLSDTPCPDSAVKGAACQTVSGSFDVFVADATQEDLNKIHEQYTAATQSGIDSGILQEKLEQADAFSPFVIEGAVDPPQPISSPLPIPTDADQDSTGGDDGISSMGIVFIIGACGIALGVGISTFQYGRREWKAKHGKNNPLSEHPKFVDTTEPWDGDDDVAAKWASTESGGDNSANRYQRQVESLVKKNCPDQMENIDTMLHQFQGREDELIKTLHDVGGGSIVEGATTIVPEEVSTDHDVESVISGLSRPRHQGQPQLQPEPHPLIIGKIMGDDELQQDPQAAADDEVQPWTASRTSSIYELQPVTVSLTSSAYGGDEAAAKNHFLDEASLPDDDDPLGTSLLPDADDPAYIIGIHDTETQ